MGRRHLDVVQVSFAFRVAAPHNSTVATDDDLDETLEETFPASDAPANTVETGIIARDLTPVFADGVSDNPARKRFELPVGEEIAFVTYDRGVGILTLVHTEVPERFRGRGVGTTLVRGAIALGRADGLRIIAQCPFVKAFLRRQREAG